MSVATFFIIVYCLSPFLSYLISLFISFVVCLQADSHIARITHAHMHVHFRSTLCSRSRRFLQHCPAVAMMPSAGGGTGGLQALVGLRSNGSVLLVIAIIIMLAYPSPNASHGRLGHIRREAQREVRKKAWGWLVGRASGHGQGLDGLWRTSGALEWPLPRCIIEPLWESGSSI